LVFFCLNGFLTLVNFVLHDPSGGTQRTDVDILGIRFPYREEMPQRPMQDHEIFSRVKDKPYVVIAEVKRGPCRLNGPWTDSKRDNMKLVMAALGIFRRADWCKVAASLHECGLYCDARYRVSLVCVGESENNELAARYPDVPQLTWEAIKFIYNRFKLYRDQKAHHPQWDEDGQRLWDCFSKCKSAAEFQEKVQLGRDALNSAGELSRGKWDSHQ
jgi:hypothetical protein